MILLVIVTVGLDGLRIGLERLLHRLLHLSGTIHCFLHELLVVLLKGLDRLIVLNLVLVHVGSDSLHPLLKELNLGGVLFVELLGSGAHLWLWLLGRPRGLRDHDRWLSSSGPRPVHHQLVMSMQLSLSMVLSLALLLAFCSRPSAILLGLLPGLGSLLGHLRPLPCLFLILLLFALFDLGVCSACKIRGGVSLEHGVSLG